MTHTTLFAANLVFIFLKAYQQRNVAGLHYWPVIPVSLLLAATEVYMIVVVAGLGIDGNLEWDHILALALGGGIGCCISMYAHDKVHKQTRETN